MGHQNILTLVDYFETMNNCEWMLYQVIDSKQFSNARIPLEVYLVTDLALGGELFDRICRKGSYYESDAADLIRATLSAVAYLHDHGIVHRDLKPENLLFRTPEDNADLLIADFGLSRIMDEEAFHVLTTTCGTPGYMAPEIFKKTGHGKPVYVFPETPPFHIISELTKRIHEQRRLGHRSNNLLSPLRLHPLRPRIQPRRNASHLSSGLLLHPHRILARRLPLGARIHKTMFNY